MDHASLLVFGVFAYIGLGTTTAWLIFRHDDTPDSPVGEIAVGIIIVLAIWPLLALGAAIYAVLVLLRAALANEKPVFRFHRTPEEKERYEILLARRGAWLGPDTLMAGDLSKTKPMPLPSTIDGTRLSPVELRAACTLGYMHRSYMSNNEIEAAFGVNAPRNDEILAMQGILLERIIEGNELDNPSAKLKR